MLIIYWIFSALLVGVDQLVKWWVTDNLAPGGARNLIPGILSLNHIRNIGVAQSILEGKTWFFTIVTLIAVVVILILMIKNREKGNRWFVIGLSLILVGTTGNFIDRIRLGYVVDMFRTDFMSFPIFNVADVTLVCEVICMLIYITLDEKDQRKKWQSLERRFTMGLAGSIKY